MTRNTTHIQSKGVNDITSYQLRLPDTVSPTYGQATNRLMESTTNKFNLSEIVVIASYPPRECGIATYTRDLVAAFQKQFGQSFRIRVCALESGCSGFKYPDEVNWILDTNDIHSFEYVANSINRMNEIAMVLIQHEYGLYPNRRKEFIDFIHDINQPVVIGMHSVLPHPDADMKSATAAFIDACHAVVVMTQFSSDVLVSDYGVLKSKISVIPHGTHLVNMDDKNLLKARYGLENKRVLATFGLMSAGKGIETTLEALPEIIEAHPDVVFLVVGMTHPEVLRTEGEKYRSSLHHSVERLGIDKHVVFINEYLETSVLLDYLQLTDVYLFTSVDPNQAVSGTFVYAMSCGCPIISTPIPHARELLSADSGVLFNFRDEKQLAFEANRLLKDDTLRQHMSMSNFQKTAFTAWENSAVAHAKLFAKTAGRAMPLLYSLPEVSLKHLENMTDDFGVIQFSHHNQPDLSTGYTLDDNARALLVYCMYRKKTSEIGVLKHIGKYLDFIHFCQQPDGSFHNYVDRNQRFTDQNSETNLSDSNGRAIWALGFLVSMEHIMPADLIDKARKILDLALEGTAEEHSTRAMAFIIKGLYYYLEINPSEKLRALFLTFSQRIMKMYLHEAEKQWKWFEPYLTYANSVMPESMLMAWLITKDPVYKSIAKESFGFLLSKTIPNESIEVITNKTWMKKSDVQKPQNAELPIPDAPPRGGQQPIDVAYTILALGRFYEAFKEDLYLVKLNHAFTWFLGNNHLGQVIYNPTTCGSYDGLEEHQVNLNQGAESTVCYLMARFTVEEYQQAIMQTHTGIPENANNRLDDSYLSGLTDQRYDHDLWFEKHHTEFLLSSTDINTKNLKRTAHDKREDWNREVGQKDSEEKPERETCRQSSKEG